MQSQDSAQDLEQLVQPMQTTSLGKSSSLANYVQERGVKRKEISSNGITGLGTKEILEGKGREMFGMLHKSCNEPQ